MQRARRRRLRDLVRGAAAERLKLWRANHHASAPIEPPGDPPVDDGIPF